MRKKKVATLGLITNQTKVSTFQSIIQNVTPPELCRVDTLEGKEYTIVPMIMMTEGVHDGSGGALYYGPDELSKTPETWNLKPVVVYHPQKNGKGISACSKEVIESSKIGFMMNTHWEDGKLKSEAWIDVVRADAVDNRIMASVTNKKMMEVSTGLFTDVEDSAGKWNKEDYAGVACNFRPDHLAILPDQVGACSNADGAGLLRNKANGKTHAESKTEIFSILSTLARQYDLTANEMSFDNIREMLRTALRAKFNILSGPEYNGPYLWVESVYKDHVVYEFNGKLFRISYTSTDTSVSLGSDAPVEVVRYTEYRAVEGALTGNQNQPQNGMNKIEKIAAILAANAGWAEADRGMLEKFSDAQIEGLHKGVTADKEVENKDNKEATPEVKNHRKSLNEWEKDAPDEVREVVANSRRITDREKDKHIAVITANKRNKFTPEYLKSRSVDELETLAELAGDSQDDSGRPLNYSGQAPTTTTNSGNIKPLGLPTMNFGKEVATK